MKNKKAPCYFFLYVYFWSSPELDGTWVIAYKQCILFSLRPTLPCTLLAWLNPFHNGQLDGWVMCTVPTQASESSRLQLAEAPWS